MENHGDPLDYRDGVRKPMSTQELEAMRKDNERISREAAEQAQRQMQQDMAMGKKSPVEEATEALADRLNVFRE
jgi:vacuolar-type H+-ATPase subunit E/Vma4